MKNNLCIKLNEIDNVAITIKFITKDLEVIKGIIACEDIPQGHKIALFNYKKKFSYNSIWCDNWLYQ